MSESTTNPCSSPTRVAAQDLPLEVASREPRPVVFGQQQFRVQGAQPDLLAVGPGCAVLCGGAWRLARAPAAPQQRWVPASQPWSSNDVPMRKTPFELP